MKAKGKTVGKTNTGKSKAKEHPAVKANTRDGNDTRKKIHTLANIPKIQFASLLERVSDGFVAFDADMNYTYVNTRGAEMLGRKPEDLIGKNYWVEYPEAKGSAFANAYVRALKERTPLQIEEYYGPFDRWFENRVYPSEDGLSVFFTEITERKQAEIRLHASEERLKRIVETMPDGIAIADRDGAITFANPPAERILGLSQTGITQRSYNDPQWRITAVDGEPFADEELPFARVKARGRAVYNVEHAIVYPDGRRVALSVNASPLYDAKGNFDGMVASFTDITERRQMEILVAGEKQVLEMIATVEPLPKILDAIARNIENQSDGMFCTILLLDSDGVHVRHGAAPSMKETFMHAIDGQPIGPNAGSCGTAAYRQEPVYVTDIASDPLWKDYRQIALEHGLRACWSTPIKSSEGKVLGTFAMYYGEPRAPEPIDLHLIELATNLAGIAIERRQAEAALAEREEKLAAIFKAAPGSMILSSLPDGKTLEVNDNFSLITGHIREEALGRTTGDLNMWANAEARDRFLSILQSQGWVRDFEADLNHKSGAIRKGLVSGRIFTVQGKKYLIGTFYDITERKQAEEQIRYQATLLENVNDAVLASDENFALTSWNKAAERIYGWTADEAIGQPGEALFKSEFIDKTRAEAIADLRETGEFLAELIQTRKDGTKIFVEARTTSLRDTQGKIIGYVSVNRDITERKQAEEALLAHRQLLETVVNYIPASVSLLRGSDLRLQLINPAYQAIAPGKEMLGKTWDELWEETGQNFTAICRQVLETGEPYNVVDELNMIRRTPEGPVEPAYFSWSLHRVRLPGDEGWGLLGTAWETTDRKLVEDEVRLSRDRLAELSRRLVEAHETESREIGRELHDQIGQMLTALKLIMEVALQLPPETRLKKHVQAQELVDELMNRVSRLSLELRPPMLDDLGLLPALLWHVNRYQEQSGIQVEFKHNGIENRRFDPQIETTVYRIVQESLTNVARHARGTRARLEVHAEGEWMQIQIEDDGSGFDPESALAKYRGLSGMSERAQLVGGTFQVESEIGKGTRLFIELPLQEGS